MQTPVAGETSATAQGGVAPRRRRLAPWLLLCASALLGACGNGNSTLSGAAPQLRIADTAFAAPTNFDVQVNGSAGATNLGYGQVTAYQSVSAGTATVKFEPTGTTTTALTATVAVGNGYNYTVFAVDSGTTTSTVTAALGNVAVPSGQAQISFVHTAASVGALDIFVTAPTAVLPATPSQSALAYAGNASSVSPIPLSLASGDYRIRAIASGDSTRAIVFDSGTVTLVAGANTLLAVVPVTGSAAAFNLLSIGADGTLLTIADQRVQVLSLIHI